MKCNKEGDGEVNMESLSAIVKCMGPISNQWKESHRDSSDLSLIGQFDEFMRLVATNETAQFMYLTRDKLKDLLRIMATTGKSDIPGASTRCV